MFIRAHMVSLFGLKTPLLPVLALLLLLASLFNKQQQSGRSRPLQHRWQPCTLALLMCICIFARVACAAASGASAAASATVDPVNGIDSDVCGVAPAPPCRTIAHALRFINVSSITLAAGVFREPTINISNIASFVISGNLSATIFSCSDRLQTAGAAFNIVNSTVSIHGVTFTKCTNPNSNGGAVSASGSSVVVSQCTFINCSAASGGAISVTGPGSDLFLHVSSSVFSSNSAIGAPSMCPNVTHQPCSTWGGAIAAFDIINVTISGCTMVSNIARASVPATSIQSSASRNAVAGGGCVSVLFFGSSIGSSVRVSGNSFLQCQVDVSGGDNVAVGNGAL